MKINLIELPEVVAELCSNTSSEDLEFYNSIQDNIKANNYEILQFDNNRIHIIINGRHHLIEFDPPTYRYSKEDIIKISVSTYGNSFVFIYSERYADLIRMLNTKRLASDTINLVYIPVN